MLLLPLVIARILDTTVINRYGINILAYLLLYQVVTPSEAPNFCNEYHNPNPHKDSIQPGITTPFPAEWPNITKSAAVPIRCERYLLMSFTKNLSIATLWCYFLMNASSLRERRYCFFSFLLNRLVFRLYLRFLSR